MKSLAQIAVEAVGRLPALGGLGLGGRAAGGRGGLGGLHHGERGLLARARRRARAAPRARPQPQEEAQEANVPTVLYGFLSPN